MKRKLVLLMLFLLSLISYGQTFLLKPHKIDGKYISGSFPLLAGKGFEAINQEIKDFIYKELVPHSENFARENWEVVRVDYKQLSQTKGILNFFIHIEINDFTFRHFEKYYSIDLKNKKKILLNNYLKERKINPKRISKAINDYLDVYRNVGEHFGEENDIQMEYFMNVGEEIDIAHHDSFYVYDENHIVIAFNSMKFTTAFKVNLKNDVVSVE